MNEEYEQMKKEMLYYKNKCLEQEIIIKRLADKIMRLEKIIVRLRR